MRTRFFLLGFLVACKSHPSSQPPIPSSSAENLPEIPSAASAIPSATPAPSSSAPHLEEIIPERVLGEYATKYAAAADDRSRNIALAASKLDGVSIQPGDKISFNQIVGPRTVAAGFKPAPVLIMGERIPGIGGGTCQVSSTLHAASLYAGLKILTRRPHSRPVAYITVGLDAMVALPDDCPESKKCDISDLVIQNSYAVPVTVKTVTSREKSGAGSLTVSILGSADPPKVEVSHWFGWTDDFQIKEKKMSNMEPGSRVRKQTGEKGRNATVQLTFTWPGKDPIRQVVHSVYPPVTEIWEVGPEISVASP